MSLLPLSCVSLFLSLVLFLTHHPPLFPLSHFLGLQLIPLTSAYRCLGVRLGYFCSETQAVTSWEKVDRCGMLLGCFSFVLPELNHGSLLTLLAQIFVSSRALY